MGGGGGRDGGLVREGSSGLYPSVTTVKKQIISVSCYVIPLRDPILCSEGPHFVCTPVQNHL